MNLLADFYVANRANPCIITFVRTSSLAFCIIFRFNISLHSPHSTFPFPEAYIPLIPLVGAGNAKILAWILVLLHTHTALNQLRKNELLFK
jgi:hypothetical protein